MKVIDRHQPGSFCWIELGTTDQQAAKKFYTALFGWEVNEFSIGPGEVYSIFRLHNQDAAAAYTLREDQLSQGVPPHWMLYVAVQSADEAAKKVGQLGGNVLMAAFDVMDIGRMAVLQDPTGAVFSVWQAKKHKGIGIAGTEGTLCWADLSTPDQQKTGSFYSKLFGWDLDPGQDKSGYLHIKNGGDYIGGIPPTHHRDPNVPPHWLLYFEVTSCDRTAAKAKQLGAKFCLEPMTMENVGQMAVLFDAHGAIFAIFEPAPRG
jgi:predicted enzyme related to lactoylglutathione lyase